MAYYPDEAFDADPWENGQTELNEDNLNARYDEIKAIENALGINIVQGSQKLADWVQVTGGGDLQLARTSGNVGIGMNTGGIGARLHVRKDGGDAVLQVHNGTDATDSRTIVRLMTGTQSGGLNYHGTAHSSSAGILRVINNNNSGAIRFWVQGDQMAVKSGRVGVGSMDPAARLDVDQGDTSAAVPVLRLDQADVSEEFVRFVGTASSTSQQSIVAESDVVADSFTPAAYLRVYVHDNGGRVTNGAYYIPLGTITLT